VPLNAVEQGRRGRQDSGGPDQDGEKPQGGEEAQMISRLAILICGGAFTPMEAPFGCLLEVANSRSKRAAP